MSASAAGGGKGPLFLLGAPRSGTSLLYKALCLHPDAAYISNYLHRFPQLPVLAVLNRAARRMPRARREVWFGGQESNAYVYGRKRPLLQRVFPMPAEGEPVFAHCGVTEQVTDLASGEGAAAGLALAQMVERITRYSGADRFLNKRIANNRRIPLLAAAFPDARFVNLVRDGRAVAYSLSQVDWWSDSVVWWYGGTPRDWAAEGRDPWRLCAEHWIQEVRALEDGLARVPDERRMDLRYEDLIAAPIDEFTRIAKFADLDFGDEWQSALLSLRYPNKNDQWRERLAPSEVDVIESVQQQELRRCGYDL